MTTTRVELAPLENPTEYHQEERTRVVPWSQPGLTITRLRLVSSPGYPVWDVSYCHGSLAGEQVRVRLPFNQLPKRDMRRSLCDHAKRSGCFIDGLFTAISTLQ